jgi:hypothetical protein
MTQLVTGTPGSASDLPPRFLIRVHSSTSKPDASVAFVAVPYRNYWFWVDDRAGAIRKQRGRIFVRPTERLFLLVA